MLWTQDISPKNAIKYQNCINVQNGTVMTGISGTKYYSSNCYIRPQFADMRRYETIGCSANTPLFLDELSEVTSLNKITADCAEILNWCLSNAVNVFVILENICPYSIQGTVMTLSSNTDDFGWYWWLMLCKFLTYVLYICGQKLFKNNKIKICVCRSWWHRPMPWLHQDFRGGVWIWLSIVFPVHTVQITITSTSPVRRHNKLIRCHPGMNKPLRLIYIPF